MATEVPVAKSETRIGEQWLKPGSYDRNKNYKLHNLESRWSGTRKIKTVARESPIFRKRF